MPIRLVDGKLVNMILKKILPVFNAMGKRNQVPAFAMLIADEIAALFVALNNGIKLLPLRQDQGIDVPAKLGHERDAFAGFCIGQLQPDRAIESVLLEREHGKSSHVSE